MKIDFIKKGNLEGILLTGLLDINAVNLFEQYVNITGDIQTAVLSLSHVIPQKFQDSRVVQWIKK